MSETIGKFLNEKNVLFNSFYIEKSGQNFQSIIKNEFNFKKIDLNYNELQNESKSLQNIEINSMDNRVETKYKCLWPGCDQSFNKSITNIFH